MTTYVLIHSPAWVEELRTWLNQGNRFPDWNDELLRDEIPDKALRARMVAELRPRTLRYFSEPLPVFAGWPAAPCGYLQLRGTNENRKTRKPGLFHAAARSHQSHDATIGG